MPQARCADARVLPYFVPVGGFMLTPRYDDDPELLGAAVKEMAQAALETTREMGCAQPPSITPAPSVDASRIAHTRSDARPL